MAPTPVEQARATVAEAVQRLGRGFRATQESPDAWTLHKGSAQMTLRLRADDPAQKFALLQVSSRVMRVPAKPGFADRLLGLNAEMGGLASFSVTRDGEVRLTAARTIEGLGAEEVERLVAQVGYFSDLYDDLLLKEYGREHALR